MANLNKVYLMGRLTRDPELRYTPKGTAVADLGLATNRYRAGTEGGDRVEETTFVDVTLWGKSAELANQYLSKGKEVFIEGRLQLDSWEDKASGQKRSKLKVVGEVMQFIGGNSGGGGSQNSSGENRGYQREDSQAAGESPSDFRESSEGGSGFEEEDDIPF